MKVYPTILPLTVTPHAATPKPPRNGNPGIVPPWLKVYDPGYPITAEPDVPHIMDARPTLYDPTNPVLPDPGYVHIM